MLFKQIVSLLKLNKLKYSLSLGKYVEPISGHELYILPASIPETNAPIVICKKITNKKIYGIIEFNFFSVLEKFFSIK